MEPTLSRSSTLRTAIAALLLPAAAAGLAVRVAVVQGRDHADRSELPAMLDVDRIAELDLAAIQIDEREMSFLVDDLGHRVGLAHGGCQELLLRSELLLAFLQVTHVRRLPQQRTLGGRHGLLQQAMELARRKGFVIGNLDATVIAQQPRLASHLPRMIERKHGGVINVSSVAVIWIGGDRIGAGEMEIGSLVAYLSYLMQILMSVMMATFMAIMIPRAAVSADRIGQVLGTESSVRPPEHPLDFSGRTGIFNVLFYILHRVLNITSSLLGGIARAVAARRCAQRRLDAPSAGLVGLAAASAVGGRPRGLGDRNAAAGESQEA